MRHSVVAGLLVWWALVLLPGAARAAPAAPASQSVPGEATLSVLNRPVAVFRTEFLGAPAQARADKARIVIEETLRQGEAQTVAQKPHPEGQLVLLGQRLAFVITAGDCDPLLQETPEQVAGAAVQRLNQVLQENREAHSLESMLKALGLAALATLILAALLWCVRRLRRWLERVLLAHTERQVEQLRIANTPLLEGQAVFPFLQRLLTVLAWVLMALLGYEWLSFVLSRFPYTRPWGEQLNGYLVGVASNIVGGMVAAIPGLGIALVIFVIARAFVGFSGRFFERISLSGGAPKWLSPEVMPTTRRLFAIAVWLFAIAMAYPYLPGAQTEAFRGLSVLLGLMISLGSSSIVGAGAAGLILIYTSTMRVGEYVRIGEHEGTVIELGMFTTRIRTGLGEELSLPNSMITGTVTKNYSRAVRGVGYIVDTTVTIGYDTPWRQVHAMLIEAALRTPGILAHPAPQVFQTALSDFYPQYRLVAQALPAQPRPRAEVLNALHGCIQDVFDEEGVPIMSPHFMADPAIGEFLRRSEAATAPHPPGAAPSSA